MLDFTGFLGVLKLDFDEWKNEFLSYYNDRFDVSSVEALIFVGLLGVIGVKMGDF